MEWVKVWGCLHEGQQAFLRFVAGWVALPDPVVYLETYRTYWLFYMGDLDTPYYDYYFLELGFTQMDVEVLPGVVAPAVTWDLSNHLALNLFLLDNPDADALHCKYKETFFALPT